MSRLAGINANDIINGTGVCVSVFLQGCPYHCKGCHNPETWDFSGGEEIPDTKKFIQKICSLITENTIQRNLSILGGEPLCPENYELTLQLLKVVKDTFPTIKTHVWTGATFESVQKMSFKDILFKYTDVLIVGPFIESKRDISLKLRGSTNQQVLYKDIDF